MTKPKADLEEVKQAFENFRAGRSERGKGRLPQHLWAAAVELLEHYPFNQVWQELRLKPEYLKRHAHQAKDKSTPSVKKRAKFLTISASQLATINNDQNGNNNNITAQAAHQARECRLVIERVDGSRLTLNLACQLSDIEALCSSFLRG